jgi:dihydroneopterin aldolase
MAMTVRIPADLDAKLEEIARSRHTSKHAVIIEAAERFVSSESKTARVLTIADGIVERFSAVEWVRVRVRKPDVVLDPPVDYAAAIVERSRA